MLCAPLPSVSAGWCSLRSPSPVPSRPPRRARAGHRPGCGPGQACGAGHGGRPTPAASRPGYCPTPPAPRGPWPRPTWRRVCAPGYSRRVRPPATSHLRRRGKGATAGRGLSRHHRAGRRRRRGTPPGEARPGWLSALGAETCGRSPRHIRGRDGRDVGAPAKGLPRASSARDHRGVIKRHRRGPPSSTSAPCDWCGRRRGAPSPCARPRRPAPVPTARRHRTESVTFAPGLLALTFTTPTPTACTPRPMP